MTDRFGSDVVYSRGLEGAIFMPVDTYNTLYGRGLIGHKRCVRLDTIITTMVFQEKKLDEEDEEELEIDLPYAITLLIFVNQQANNFLGQTSRPSYCISMWRRC